MSDKTKWFIEKAELVHGNKYDYSKVEYINYDTKIIIICPIHGKFHQTPNKHLHGQGCPLCGNFKISKQKTSNTEEFISKAKQVHGDKYDYSKLEYNKSNQKVCITCPIHGDFYQTPNKHLCGQGCPLCIKNKKITLEEFKNRCSKIHNNKYDYSNVEFNNLKDIIFIHCPIHGCFKQIANKHIIGEGCPKCNQSHLEKDIEQLLIENNLEYYYQKKFKWLGQQSLDFYLPQYNIAIECQGEQHFKPVKYFGGLNKFNKTVNSDKLKKEKCKENNIEIFYFSKEKDKPQNYFSTIYIDKEQLISSIKNYANNRRNKKLI